MIRFLRSACVMPGRVNEVLSYAREIGPYVKKLAGVDIEFATEIGGETSRVGWFSAYPSLAAFEQANTKCLTDPKFQEMYQKVAACFAPGSMHEKIWQISQTN